MSGKVVVNRCMSLDGFIAGPATDGLGRCVVRSPTAWRLTISLEVGAATGAVLVGRRTWR